MSAVRRYLVLLALCGCVDCGTPPAEPGPDALTVLLPRDAEQLDPRFVADPYGLKITRLLFDSLITIDPRTLEVVPELAESFQWTSDTRLEVRLRPGLKFSDGSALDSDDVVATFEGVVDPELGSIYAGSYQRIQQVLATSPTELVFTLDAPHATFITDLEIPIVREEDARRRIALEGEDAPVGSGAYVLAERRAGRIVLEANPHWHGGEPAHARVVLLAVRDDNTRALRMLAGAGDVAINAVPPLLIPMFEEDSDFVVSSAPGVGTSYLGFNTESALLGDLRVRRAIAHAIDRETLVATELEGRANLTESWIPAGHWASMELPRTEFDPALSRRLLDEAGVRGATLILRTSADRARLSIARAIASMLEDVGLRVRVRPSEVATMIDDLNGGRFDLTLLQVPEVFEPHLLNWFFASSHIPSAEHRGANRWRLRDEIVDRALEEGRQTSDINRRIEAYAIVQRRLQATLPVFPLWQEETVVVRRRTAQVDVPRDGRLGTLAR